MCNATCSESGQLLTINPCGWYVKLLSEVSRLEGRCVGLESGNAINLECIKRQDEQLVNLLAEYEELQRRVERLENGILSALEYWNRCEELGAMSDALYEIENRLSDALAKDPDDD